MLTRRTVLGSTLAGIAGVVGSAVRAADTSDDTFTAARDGNWSDPATWESGSVPTDGSDVSIPDGITVTVTQPITTRVKYLNVAGTLCHAPDHDSKLRVETIETQSGSRYEIGTGLTPVQRGVTAEVEFIDEGPIDEDEWPNRRNKGLVARGEVEIAGAQKTPWTTLSQNPTAGDTAIELSGEPTNWKADDEIVLPGLDPYSSTSLEHTDERRTIASVSGTTVTFETALEYDHVPPKSGLDSYVLNLTRNVVFSSENTDEHRRGHVMIMSTGSNVRYVRFEELGRTNKDEPITNPVRNADEVDADDPNPAARYPFHYHRTGMESEPHYAEGLAVDGSPGWGVVNHHAYADIVDSVTYDVFGSGFVAEGGNERGSFERNIAVRSRGSGETIDARAAGDHGGDPPIDDFGHAGHGFWLQSPLVDVVDNVAAGHRHQAFVWWLRPLLDKPQETLAEESCAGGDIEDSRVTFCPNVPMKYVPDEWPILEAIEEGRFSNNDELMRDTQKIPSTFAPLATVSGNTAYGAAGGLDFSRHNFKWKHERFSDFDTIDDFTVYNIGPFYGEDGDVREPDLPRHQDAGHQGRGGSVGVSFRYTSNVTLRNSWLIGTGRDDSIGVPLHDYLWTNTIENSTIEDWDWGVATGEHRLSWVRNNTFRNNDYDVNWSFDNVGPAILDGNELEAVRHKGGFMNQKATEVLTFGRSRGVRVNGRSAHVERSAPDFVPFPDTESLGSVNNIEDIETVDDETDLVGLTNAEMLDGFDICVSGKVLPADAVEASVVEGSLLDPSAQRNPPRDLHLDATNVDSLGAFEVVSEPDAARDKALRCTGSGSPKDNPASVSFDCAEGTYSVTARVWPDSWNGDTVSFRIDGGTWKDAEKLKSPIGFRWHDASPRNGDTYEWELSEGTHTLEFTCENDGVLVDELFIGSGQEVLGAYGESVRSSEPELSVTTKNATNVGDTSATLNGSLDDLGGADSADCYFEYRQSGDSSWNATSTKTLSNTGTFSIDVSGLSSETDYEYRAVADASDSDSNTGKTTTFTTSSSNAAPSASIDSVSEDESLLGLSSHTGFDVSWSASDSDADLHTAELTLYDDTDTETEDSETIDISGGSATVTTTLKAKHDEGSGNDYTVKLVVTDSNRNSDTDTASVSET